MSKWNEWNGPHIHQQGVLIGVDVSALLFLGARFSGVLHNMIYFNDIGHLALLSKLAQNGVVTDTGPCPSKRDATRAQFPFAKLNIWKLKTSKGLWNFKNICF
jgi:hypothetical protein